MLTHACKEFIKSRDIPAPNLKSKSDFPPLPTSAGRQSNARSFVNNTQIGLESSISLQQDGTFVAEQMDFCSLLFGDPVAFLAFLAEVIKQAILAKDRNYTIDVSQIITEAAGGRMGLPVDAVA